MPKDRFYLDVPFQINAHVILQDKEAHHLAKVMRISEEEIVELVNGRGFLAHAKVTKVKKNEVELTLLSIDEKKNPYSIILCQAIPRLNRLDYIVEKGVELGMDALWLFPGKLSEKKTLSENSLERLKAISISAMKQCGRYDLPEMSVKSELAEWSPFKHPAYFGDTQSQAPLFTSLWKKTDSVLFFVGPEAGFTPEENKILIALGAKGVKLHPNILRTDTAPLVALSLISHWMMK